VRSLYFHTARANEMPFGPGTLLAGLLMALSNGHLLPQNSAQLNLLNDRKTKRCIG